VGALQIDGNIKEAVIETFKKDADLLWAVKVNFAEAL